MYGDLGGAHTPFGARIGDVKKREREKRRRRTLMLKGGLQIEASVAILFLFLFFFVKDWTHLRFLERGISTANEPETEPCVCVFLISHTPQAVIYPC